MDIPSDLELSGRILLAIVLGAVIGLEREVRDHPAGLRTHATVSLGAALFGIISAYAFTEFEAPRASTVHQVDVTRVASTVVTGVGFLGGGAILKYGASVRGLTTAASLWATAAIGLGVGLGSYVPSFVATAGVLLILVVLLPPRRWIARSLGQRRDTVVIRLPADTDPRAVVGELTGLEGVEIHSLTIERKGDEVLIEADASAPAGDLEALLAPLGNRPEVRDLQVT
jgi:putative Mg2+ transporter-C (MgtC) family protein